MAKSTRDNAKIRKSRPPQTGTLIGVRLQPPELAQLDAWIADQPEPRPTRPEALRHMARVVLGYLTKDAEDQKALAKRKSKK